MARMFRWRRGWRKWGEERNSFLKKRTKKLLFRCRALTGKVGNMEDSEPVHISSLIPANLIVGEDDAETQALSIMHKKAERYLLDFQWRKKITSAYFGYGVSPIIAVFYFEIEPEAVEIDQKLWVIVGDIPSAYIVTDRAKSPKEAIVTYIELFRDWIAAVKAGLPITPLVPAGAPATLNNAADLEIRLDFLDQYIVPELD